MHEYITLYAGRTCPYAQRVEIVLKEAGLPYDRYEIDIKNKPAWYAPKVNPANKIPTLAYGGPKVPPDQPSPESQKLTESIVLTEFVADITDSLRPKDPVLRARVRFFINTFTTRFYPDWKATYLQGENPDIILPSIEAIQELLPPEGYAAGEWSIADAVTITFFARVELALKNDYGAFEPGAGKKTCDELFNSPKFERFRRYLADCKSRKSFQETFHEADIMRVAKTRFRPKQVETGA